jgi:biopolymer transport protein ExbD
MQTTNAGLRTPTSYAGLLGQTTYASRLRKPAELNLVAMIDIFTVLVTFLLMTAVFSRITILQLDLPSSTASPGTSQPAFRLEVIVRKEGFELTNGTELIAAIPKVEDEYDFKTLSEMALSLKRENPDTDDASVLLEREIPYDYLIQVMDAIRSTEAPADSNVAEQSEPIPQSGGAPTTDPKPKRVALFAHIAVGEAP